MNREEIIENARKKAKEWVNSPTFESDMEESMRQVQATIDRIEETQKIDYEELMKPFDI